MEIMLLFISSLSKAVTTDTTPLWRSMLKLVSWSASSGFLVRTVALVSPTVKLSSRNSRISYFTATQYMCQKWEDEECSFDCQIKHYTSTYGVQCDDYCGQRGESYHWCNSREGWDYCSPSNNVDYYGNPCHKDYPCNKYGQKYYWCYLETGGWDYCGQVLPRTKTHMTRYGDACTDACRYGDSEEYYWCYTENSWGYCSPQPDVTYQNVPCRSDHRCETHGYDYSWCYTNYNDDWDYCGVTSLIPCMHPMSRRSKRSPDNPRICTWEDNNHRVITVTEEDAEDDITRPTNNIRDEALELIQQWEDYLLRDQPVSGVLTSQHLHLDIQSIIIVNNQRCYNLQIQLKKSRSKGESTTISQLICTLTSQILLAAAVKVYTTQPR
ncbi:hypothetical protein INR49_003080 [Caranx melampygus]|nr:hypothetical protein INR49_003080 [Caranx melampygus]